MYHVYIISCFVNMYHLLANTFLASGRKRPLSTWILTSCHSEAVTTPQINSNDPRPPKINPCIVSQSLPIENDAHFIWIYPDRQLKTRLLVVQKKMSKARWLAIVRPENQFLRTKSPTTTLINNKISHQISECSKSHRFQPVTTRPPFWKLCHGEMGRERPGPNPSGRWPWSSLRKRSTWCHVEWNRSLKPTWNKLAPETVG